MEEKFSHTRTKRDLERYMHLWPDADEAEAANAESNGKAIYESVVGGEVIVVHLYDYEQIHVFISNGDQSGAETAMHVTLNVDDARIATQTCGGSLQRLLEELPVEAQEIIKGWRE